MDIKCHLDKFMIFLDRVWIKGRISCSNIIKLTMFIKDDLYFDIPCVDDSSRVNFDYKFSVPPGNNSSFFNGWFHIRLEDGTQHDIYKPYIDSINIDPKNIQTKFRDMMFLIPSGNMLEIGSYGGTGTFVKKHFLPENWTYTRFDIRDGDNVDVIDDSHELSKLLPSNHFDSIMSLCVFEHIFMPWKVAIEMNKVMKIGAIGYISAPQAWPVHALPWDFWRYTENAWHSIFNKFTGFEIIDALMSQPAYLYPYVNNCSHAVDSCSYQHSAVLFRKISETSLEWSVNLKEIITSIYPEHQ